MRFIHVQPVNTELFKGNDIIFLFFRFQLLQADFQRALCTFQLLNGIAFTTVPFHFHDSVRDIVDLLLQQPLLPFLGYRNPFKLAVAKNDGIIITCGNPSAELLAVGLFKVFLICNKDIRAGIQAKKLRSPLFSQVVGYHKHCLLAQAEALGLHDCGNHFKGFASTDFMSKERITAVENMRDRIPLMFTQINLRGHSIKGDMTAVKLAGPD